METCDVKEILKIEYDCEINVPPCRMNDVLIRNHSLVYEDNDIAIMKNLIAIKYFLS